MAKKLLLIGFVALVVLAVWISHTSGWLSFESLKASQSWLLDQQAQNKLLFLSVFACVYVVTTALSVPGAGTVLTLAAGALFGFFQGLVVVSFASTIGATIAFLIARYLARDFVQDRFSNKLQKINEGFRKDGGFYLFTMRLVPLFPFFAVNLLMALTPIKTSTYYWVSQLGMLPGTAVYVNAGTQLSSLESTSDIASPALIVSFVLLGVFPIIAKKGIAWLRQIRDW